MDKRLHGACEMRDQPLNTRNKIPCFNAFEGTLPNPRQRRQCP